MNSTPVSAHAVSVVICPLSAADEAGARAIADQLSAVGVKVLYIAHADKDPHAALRLASQTASERGSAYIAVVSDSDPEKGAISALNNDGENNIPVYRFMSSDSGGRNIYRIEQGGLVLMNKSESAISLALGGSPNVHASEPAPQSRTPAAVYVPVNNTGRNRKRHTAVIVCAALACLILLLPIVQCARGCYLCGGPLYVAHEPIDTSPYTPKEQENDGAQDLLGAFLDTPSETMQDYDAAEQAELMEDRTDGDFEYAQFIGGDLKGLGYINGYNGSEKNVTLPRELGGLEIVGVSGAFNENKTIVSVTVPEGYVNIGYNTFRNCSSLKSVKIPGTVTDIEQCAFFGCSALTGMTLPDSVESIGDSTFYRCYSLESVKLPSGLKTLGNDVFWECTSLRELVLPDSVTHLGDKFCYGCENLAVVKLGAKITSVPKYAFYGCSSLDSIKFGDRTDTIEEQAFRKSGLTGMTVPDGVSFIGSYAFFDCARLKKISLPASVNDINGVPFVGCTSLESIEVRGEGSRFTSVDGVLFTKNESILVDFPSGRGGKYTVPEGTREIGERAFADASRLTEVSLPDSLRSIGPQSFCGCGISEANIPDGVQSIGESAFGQCPELKKLHIGADVTDIGETVAMQCPELAEITISPENKCFAVKDGKLRKTEDNTVLAVFGGVKGKLVIPEGTKRIGKYEYADNTGLTSVVFPKSLETIDERAFAGCTSLKEIQFGGNEKEIGIFAFSGCASLTSVELPDSVENVMQMAFENCVSLENVRLGANTVNLLYAFSGCSSLRTVELPDGIEDIWKAFKDCSSLEYIRIPDSVTKPNDAFEGCTSLRYVVFGSGARSTSNLFDDFTNLREIYVPAGMKFYTDWVKDCHELERVYYGGTKREWDLSLRMDRVSPSVFDGVEFIYNCETPPEYDPSRFAVSSSDIG